MQVHPEHVDERVDRASALDSAERRHIKRPPRGIRESAPVGRHDLSGVEKDPVQVEEDCFGSRLRTLNPLEWP